MIIANILITSYEERELINFVQRLIPEKLLESIRRHNKNINYKTLYEALLLLYKAFKEDNLYLPQLTEEQLNAFYEWVEMLDYDDSMNLLRTYYLMYDPKIFLDDLRELKRLMEKDIQYMQEN